MSLLSQKVTSEGFVWGFSETLTPPIDNCLRLIPWHGYSATGCQNNTGTSTYWSLDPSKKLVLEEDNLYDRNKNLHLQNFVSWDVVGKVVWQLCQKTYIQQWIYSMSSWAGCLGYGEAVEQASSVEGSVGVPSQWNVNWCKLVACGSGSKIYRTIPSNAPKLMIQIQKWPQFNAKYSDGLGRGIKDILVETLFQRAIGQVGECHTKFANLIAWNAIKLPIQQWKWPQSNEANIGVLGWENGVKLMMELHGFENAFFIMLGTTEELLFQYLLITQDSRWTYENNQNETMDTVMCLDGILINYWWSHHHFKKLSLLYMLRGLVNLQHCYFAKV
jgi:hypothetical protein